MSLHICSYTRATLVMSSFSEKRPANLLAHLSSAGLWDLLAAERRMTEQQKNWEVATNWGVARKFSLVAGSLCRGRSCQRRVTWSLCSSRAAQSHNLCTHLNLPHSPSFTTVATFVASTPGFSVLLFPLYLLHLCSIVHYNVQFFPCSQDLLFDWAHGGRLGHFSSRVTALVITFSAAAFALFAFPFF